MPKVNPSTARTFSVKVMLNAKEHEKLQRLADNKSLNLSEMVRLLLEKAEDMAG